MPMACADGDDAAADDFGHIRACIDGDDEDSRKGRIHEHARVLRAVINDNGLHNHRRAAEYLNIDVHQHMHEPEQAALDDHACIRAGLFLFRQRNGANDGHEQAEREAQRRACQRDEQGHARSAQEQHAVFLQQKGHPAKERC